ncbi:MAG: hypothetical protein KCHDKBKB_01986 [Elusimicrobia bacterium]|nr:hypothetical protein [Elusimicrobiota bacterium]
MSQLTFEGFSTGLPTERPLSHSSLQLYKACPQRWKFRYVDKVPEKPRSFFSFGKSVHTGLEFLFEKGTEGIPSLELVLEHYKTSWRREGYESAAQEKWFFQEGERILKGFYAKHQADFKNVFQIEYKFNFLIEGIPVTGFIDRIDQTAKGGLSVMDYKTGKAFDKARVKSDPQLTLYQMAVQEIFQKPVESVSLYHLNSLTPISVPAHSKTMENNIRALVVEVAKGISDQKFDPKPDERGQCQWCDYKQICPAFSNGKSAALSGLVSPETKEKIDKLGKLDERLESFLLERQTLAEEVAALIRSTGGEKIEGKHYTAKMEKPSDGISEKIVTTLLKTGEPS